MIFRFIIIEITLQTQTLLISNGYGNDILTNQPEFIYLYSMILISNVFYSKIIVISFIKIKWMLGFIFEILLFIFDQFHDSCYSAFPIILYFAVNIMEKNKF